MSAIVMDTLLRLEGTSIGMVPDGVPCWFAYEQSSGRGWWLGLTEPEDDDAGHEFFGYGDDAAERALRESIRRNMVLSRTSSVEDVS